MNWDRIEGHWKQQRGKAINHWGRLMNDELAAAAGKYEKLVGRLQKRFGKDNDRDQRRIESLRKQIDRLRKTNARLRAIQAKSRKGGASKPSRKPGNEEGRAPRRHQV